MNKTKIILGVFVGIILFTGLVLFGGTVAPRLQREAKPFRDEFYRRSQVEDYEGAHQLLSTALGSGISTRQLAEKWSNFERLHGTIKEWQPHLDGLRGGNLVNLYPRSVDFADRVTGTGGGAALVTIRMVPQDGGWRLDKLIIQAEM